MADNADEYEPAAPGMVLVEMRRCLRVRISSVEACRREADFSDSFSTEESIHDQYPYASPCDHVAGTDDRRHEPASAVPHYAARLFAGHHAFCDLAGSPAGIATEEDLRRYQIDQTEMGVGAPAMNTAVSALRFFFIPTFDRPDMIRRMALARKLLGVAAPIEKPEPDEPTDHCPPCPCCGGHMTIIDTFARWCQPRETPSPTQPLRENAP